MIQWDYAAAAHLLRRAGFGGTRSDVLRAVKRGQRKTVRSLLSFKPSKARVKKDDLYEAQIWWVRRMLGGPSPVQEKLVLFWHGHFATSVSKVDDARLMIEQNRTFRSLGGGKFKDLLLAASHDGAMIRWLDGHLNTKDSPNENFAREVMELFTLGIVNEQGQPNYTQKDVTEAARAFTGYDNNEEEGFHVHDWAHDYGEKTILGVTGPLSGDDVIVHLAGMTQCARFLAAKLWAFYAYPNPETAVIDALAQAYLDNDSDIKAVLAAMFLRDEFYSARARGERISSPAEFVVGTLRSVRARTNAERIPGWLSSMGQELYNPPNVAGWPGGLSWVTSVRQLGRFEFAWTAAAARRREKELSTSTKPLLDGLKKHPTPADVVDHVLQVLGPIDAPAETRTALADYLQRGDGGGVEPFDVKDPDTVDKKVRGLAGLALMLPEAQLV